MNYLFNYIIYGIYIYIYMYVYAHESSSLIQSYSKYIPNYSCYSILFNLSLRYTN